MAVEYMLWEHFEHPHRFALRTLLEVGCGVLLAVGLAVILARLAKGETPEKDQGPLQCRESDEKEMFKIAVLGPLSGDKIGHFGRRQARSLLAAIFHTFEASEQKWIQQDWRKRFDFEFIDTAQLDPIGLRKKFVELQDGAFDAVFGPMRSEEALHLLAGVRLNVPTILAAAATTGLDKHDDYGVKLLQLVPNLEVHARHLSILCERYKALSPKLIIVVHGEEDEYGECTAKNIETQVDQIPVEAVTYKKVDRRLAPNAVEGICKSIESKISGGIGPSEVLLVVADVGEALQAIVKAIRNHRRLKDARRLSFTPVGAEKEMKSLYLICSYSPIAFSPNAPDLVKYVKSAEQELWDYPNFSKKCDPLQNHEPLPVNSTDAEVHDAAVYWLRHYVMPRMAGVSETSTRSLYVTNFRVETERTPNKEIIRNKAALHVYQVGAESFESVATKLRKDS